MRLKVLIVASWYPTAKTPFGGSFVREQALALADRGHDVQVVSFDRDTNRLPLTIQRRRDGALVEHAVAVRWPLHRVFGFYLLRPLVNHVRKIMEDFEPDVVHAHAVRPAGVVATLAAQENAVPVVVTEHKAEIRDYWLTPHGRRQIERAYLTAGRLYAVSASHKQSVEHLFPATRGDWIINHNGVDTKLFSIRTARRLIGAGPHRKILFLGGLLERKGLPLVLEALSRLPRAHRLTVAGPGADQRQVDLEARRFGVADRVTAVGLVGRTEVVALLNDHDVLALASRYESFGLVCAEALACGTPVVATRCGGPAEIVREPFGRLVEPGDSVALAAAMMETPRPGVPWDPELARQYVCDKFSMESLASRLEADYLRLSGSGRELRRGQGS